MLKPTSQAKMRKIGIKWILLSLFICGLILPLATAAQSPDGSNGHWLNGWLVFLGILMVLASGLYFQSTRRQIG